MKIPIHKFVYTDEIKRKLNKLIRDYKFVNSEAEAKEFCDKNTKGKIVYGYPVQDPYYQSLSKNLNQAFNKIIK